MRNFNGRELKALVILSIVIPVGLLATSRLTGILKEPAVIGETNMLDSILWEFERPACDIEFWNYISSLYSYDILVNQTIFIDDYNNDAGIYVGSPALQMNLSLYASLPEGHIENINITFYEDYFNSCILIPDLYLGGKSHTLAVWHNLTMESSKNFLQGIGNIEKAFISFDGISHPKMAYIRLSPTWILRSLYNRTHQLTVCIMITYFNGTSYKKTVQPFQLKLIADDNNCFEKAEEMALDHSNRKHVIGGYDTEDFYKVYLTKDETAQITIMPSKGQDLDLYLYSPADKNSPVASLHKVNFTSSLEYKVDLTGWWFVQVESNSGWGIYDLAITLL